MSTIVCLFVIFSHVVVSLFSIYEFDCPSVIFRPSFVHIEVVCYRFLFNSGLNISYNSTSCVCIMMFVIEEREAFHLIKVTVNLLIVSKLLDK